MDRIHFDQSYFALEQASVSTRRRVFSPLPFPHQIHQGSFDGTQVQFFLVLLWISCRIAFSFLSFLLTFQIPTGKDAGKPVALILKDQTQSSSTMSSAI